MTKKAPKYLPAFILQERQNLIEKTIQVTIAHFEENTITGSPSELLNNTLLVERMKNQHLFRLSFLAGIEQQEVAEKRVVAIQVQKNRKP